jgi:alpha-aminoadipic semialdehyde synthase
LENLYGGNTQPRLQVIGDITCDINGSLECTVRATDSEQPVYVFEPFSGQTIDGLEGRGPVVMAVYNLPAELPLESSTYFSQQLKTYIPGLAQADFKQTFEQIELDPVVKRAVIAYRGELTPGYQYLNEYLKNLKL